MCTGFELLLGALGIGGAVAPLLVNQEAPEPPPLPALTPAGARAPGATVRVGTGQDEGVNKDANAPGKKTFTAKRVGGSGVSGLGRSGLAL